MRRASAAAVWPLMLLAVATTFVNPTEHVDLTKVWAEIPPNLTALGGDVQIRLHNALDSNLRVRLSRENDDSKQQLAYIPLKLDQDNIITLPCGYFSRGGTYYLELTQDLQESYNIEYNFTHLNFVEISSLKKHPRFRKPFESDKDIPYNGDIRVTDHNVENITEETPTHYVDRMRVNSIESIREVNQIKRNQDDGIVWDAAGDGVYKEWTFEVLWPKAVLHMTPAFIYTYPEEPVTAVVEFPGVLCTPLESAADFWLELLFCGYSDTGSVLCDGKNTTSRAHVLYSEQMYGFPGRRTMHLQCELFGQAGDYALILRPAGASLPQDLAITYIKAGWSSHFLLNVNVFSVFPCDEGVRALFQYPQCMLEGSDRVRLFGKYEDKMKYITERRVRRGQHTALFDCQLFSERFPEYCFVYVSQAVTGAVSDVRYVCLTTMPVDIGGAGGWGEWSDWSRCPDPTQCTTQTTRSRHRFCDNPPPAYGAKYCEGKAVELEACECQSRPWLADTSVVVAEVGARCRCGCVLHLAPTARLLAGSARACPARSFWLLQAEEGLVVRLRIESVRLPCTGQSLRARDGDSLGAPLLASWNGAESRAVAGDVQASIDSMGVVEITGGRHILVELQGAPSTSTDKCAGGFLAHAIQIEPIRNTSSPTWASVTSVRWWRDGGGARGAAVALAALAALAALCLALHSAQRNKAYQRAADKESLTDSDGNACSASLEMGIAPAGSRSTLLSEVVGGAVSLRRLLPSGRKHTRLRDQDTANDAEQRDEGDQTDQEENNEEDQPFEPDSTSTGARSSASQATVTPENVSSSSAPAGQNLVPPPLKVKTYSAADVSASMHSIQSPPQQSMSDATEDVTSVTSVSERNDSCSEKDRDSAWEKDRDSTWEKDRSESRASSSVSAATLTNGWYSPALSGVSAARIRDNPKHTKESCNRRLLKSDLSLSSHPEMEIDYYDYEVNNAGSVPGSYLGMDPAFLVWIPPLDEGDMRGIGDKTPIYEEIVPKDLRPDPGSNTESPEDIPSSSLRKQSDNSSIKSDDSNSTKSSRRVVDRTNIIHPLNFSISDLQNSPKNKRKLKKESNIALKDLTLTRSPVNVHKKLEKCLDNTATLKRINDTERETNSDTLKKGHDYSEIKFADENSDSSCDIKFADDSPDSNRLVDKYDSMT